MALAQAPAYASDYWDCYHLLMDGGGGAGVDPNWHENHEHAHQYCSGVCGLPDGT